MAQKAIVLDPSSREPAWASAEEAVFAQHSDGELILDGLPSDSVTVAALVKAALAVTESIGANGGHLNIVVVDSDPFYKLKWLLDSIGE